MNDEKITTGSWLPVFPGFYGTLMEDLLDRNTDYDLEYIKDMELPEELKDVMIDKFYYSDAFYSSRDRAEKYIAEQCTSLLEKELKEKGFLVSIKFEELCSPREYNFANDSINVTYTFSAENIQNIRHFVSEHFIEWKDYLKRRYTSCSGFISHHANDTGAEEWFVDNAMNDRHNAGAVLEFICIMLMITTETLYYNCEELETVDLIALQKECIDKGWYVPDTLWWNRLKAKWRNMPRFERRSGWTASQYILNTSRQTYIFAISKAEANNKNFIVKRYWKYFIFARLKDEKKKKS